jgi:hypothetical protein
VIARTLQYVSSPLANASRIRGRSRSRRATRTCSRAVTRPIEQRQERNWAHDFAPQLAHPRRSSNSATSNNHRQVAAAMWAANSQISASSRSSCRRSSRTWRRRSSKETEGSVVIEVGSQMAEHMFVTLRPESDGKTAIEREFVTALHQSSFGPATTRVVRGPSRKRAECRSCPTQPVSARFPFGCGSIGPWANEQ